MRISGWSHFAEKRCKVSGFKKVIPVLFAAKQNERSAATQRNHDNYFLRLLFDYFRGHPVEQQQLHHHQQQHHLQQLRHHQHRQQRTTSELMQNLNNVVGFDSSNSVTELFIQFVNHWKNHAMKNSLVTMEFTNKQCNSYTFKNWFIIQWGFETKLLDLVGTWIFQ